MAANQTYNAENITVLEGLEAVRKRPGMYIGSVSAKGLNHLIYEMVDNSVDEHLAGFCSEIQVILEKDGSATISDNGRGVPVDMHQKGVSAARLVYTTLHAGGKFDDSAYKTSGGLHGVGSSVVNALSVYMDVKISRDGYIHHDRYERGIPVVELENGLLPKIGKTKKTGTTVNFLPDDQIFEKTRFRSGDIFSPQDCVGAGGLNLDNLEEWFSKLKQAVNTKPGLKFWGNIETFDQRFWITAPLERIKKQLEVVNGYVGNLICFAYSHYNSPFVVNKDYHKTYLQYCCTGQLPVIPIPDQVLTVNTNKTSKGIEIQWVPGDLTAVDGYSIYRDGTLIKKIQITSEKLPRKYIDKEGSLDCTYEIATYNVIGQESAKIKAE